MNHEISVNDEKKSIEFLNELSQKNNNELTHSLVFDNNEELELGDYSFFRIKQISHDEDYPHREAFENVLYGIDSDDFNFVYVISGNESGIKLYIGCVKNTLKNNQNNFLKASDYAENLSKIFYGNFSGSVLEKIDKTEIESEILFSKERYKDFGLFVGTPTFDKEKNSDNDFQGMERLINSMMGENWRIIIINSKVNQDTILEHREHIYQIYDKVQMLSKVNININKADNTNSSLTKDIHFNTSFNTNDNFSKTKSSNEDHHNEHHTKGSSTSEQASKGSSNGYGSNVGASLNTASGTQDGAAVSFDIMNRKAKEILDYIDEVLLEKIKIGYTKGLFKTTVYCLAENPSLGNRLKNGIQGLFQSKSSSFSPLIYCKLNSDFVPFIKSYQQGIYNSRVLAENNITERYSLMGLPICDNKIELATYLTADEISLIAGLPQKEVPGLQVCENVDFGLNFDHKLSSSEISLGYIIQNGKELKSIKYSLDKSILNKHIFIAGTTGSGKTTTCHKILSQSKLPFLVIEPIKSEYRILHDSFKGNIEIFTVGDEKTAPFRINPFELTEGEMVSTHADMLTATFTSAFPMEGSMPQIIEEAIYKCYKDKNFSTVDIERPDNCDFPILADFVKALSEIVKEKKFSERLGQDYIGTLVSRFSNLLIGSKGLILNCHKTTSFSELLRKNVVLELENVASREDKSLLMGIILMRLNEEIKLLHKKDTNFRHITLVEEAHRLLSKVEYGDTGNKKNAVGTFCDMLAEVRKYGESLIIVDQSPGKLASDVIKNTNTKIIHKLSDEEDQAIAASSTLMDDKQKKFLVTLSPGEAVLFSEGNRKPILIHVERETNTTGKEISNNEIIELFKRNHFEEYAVISIFNGTFKLFIKQLKNDIASGNIQPKIIEDFCSKIVKEANNNKTIIDALIQKQSDLMTGNILVDKSSIDFFTRWLKNSLSAGDEKKALFQDEMEIQNFTDCIKHISI